MLSSGGGGQRFFGLRSSLATVMLEQLFVGQASALDYDGCCWQCKCLCAVKESPERTIFDPPKFSSFVRPTVNLNETAQLLAGDNPESHIIIHIGWLTICYAPRIVN